MERKVKEGGGSLLTKRIDLRGRERSPSADPSSPTRFCPWCKRSRALSVEKWRGICSKRRGMDVYGYHQDQLHAFPSLIAVVKHFTTIFLRTDFYPSSVKERIFARNCLLSLSLSSFSLPDNFVEDTRWIIHIPSMEIWMSRRGDSFTTRNSKGHGIYRDSSTIVKFSFGLKGEEKRMFARHTRYANVRNVKKRFFDFFFPSFFLGNRPKKKGYLITRGIVFVSSRSSKDALERERKASPFVFFHSFFSSDDARPPR